MKYRIEYLSPKSRQWVLSCMAANLSDAEGCAENIFFGYGYDSRVLDAETKEIISEFEN